jgi:hypothetical protein
MVAAEAEAARETTHRAAAEAATVAVAENILRGDAAAEEAIEVTTATSGTATETPPEGTITVKTPEIATTADTGDTTTDLIQVALRNRVALENVTVETRIREGLIMDQTTKLRASLMKSRDLDLEAIDDFISNY